MTRWSSWATLLLLLVLNLVAAAFFGRGAWPGFVGDEATYLMQGQSLAWDLDIRYSKADYDRFLAQWQTPPEGLILQSSDGGKTLTYGKPLAYSAYLAPFLRAAPRRGAAIANALLLALAAVAATLTLERRVGPAAALFVAAFVFASVTFAHVFWIHSDLFLMCLVALAYALAWGGRQHRVELTEIYEDVRSQGRAAFLGRWALAGALLAVVVVARPVYAPLLLPVAFAVPAARRAQGLAALVVAAGAVAVGLSLADLATRGTWTSYGAERHGYYSYTGFPEVQLGAAEWQKAAQVRGASWLTPQTFEVGFEARQSAWNVLYVFAGRHVGVLPYFLPLLLGFAAYRPGEGRRVLVLAALLTVAIFLYFKATNFYGGGGSLANRYFLPVYPAFWFLAARRISPWAPAATALLASLYLVPTWTGPWRFPLTEEGGYRHVSAFAARWLPYETTQSHLKPSGGEDVSQGGLWIKPLTPGAKAQAGGTRLGLAAGATAELLVGAPRPIERVFVAFHQPAPAKLEVRGGTFGRTAFSPGGGTVFEIELGGERASHRMWWTNEPYHLYQLTLAIPPGDRMAGKATSFSLASGAGD